MSLPSIDPTGVMSSGNYVDYMIGYNNSAADSITTQLASYTALSVLDDWHTQWDRTISDIQSDVTTLRSDFNKVKIKVEMVKDAISKL